MKDGARFLVIASVLAACGGGDADVELAIEPPLFVVDHTVTLRGTSFVPPSSLCPASNEYVRIGTLGAHQITYANAATGVTGPVFSDLWVCNSGDGRTMAWTSNPITLVAGSNEITVTMTAPSRSSSATIVVVDPG